MAIRSLLKDRRGISAVEFGLIAPAMCMTLLALGDICHTAYVQGLLDGEMQKVARESAIEGGALKAEEIDARMRAMVRSISGDATVETTRQTFPTFQAIAPERFSDDNGNNQRDAGECFDDVNGNRAWDLRPFRTGQGGANDVTVIRAVATWPRLFPLGGFLGLPDDQVIASETVLKNQPFAVRNEPTPEPVCI